MSVFPRRIKTISIDTRTSLAIVPSAIPAIVPAPNSPDADPPAADPPICGNKVLVLVEAAELGWSGTEDIKVWEAIGSVDRRGILAVMEVF